MSLDLSRRNSELALTQAVRCDRSGRWQDAHKYYGLCLQYFSEAIGLGRSQRSPSVPQIGQRFVEALSRVNYIRTAILGLPEASGSDFASRESARAAIPYTAAQRQDVVLRYPPLAEAPAPAHTPSASLRRLSGPATTSPPSPRTQHHPSFSLSDFIVQISDYDRIRGLGQGSFGAVYCARKRGTEELVAIKTLSANIAATDDQRSLIREIESLARANHPALLRLVGFTLSCSDADDYPAILTEFLPNGSLQDVLDRKRPRLNPTQKMIVLYGIAEGMRYLHEELGIVHRDLKPANVMMNKDNEPVVGDFGLSKLIKAPKMRQTAVAGSPVYMAPELIREQEYSGSADVYAYAFVAFEILSETLAFDEVQSVEQLKQLVLKGIRPRLVDAIPKNYKDLIIAAWDQRADIRPTFAQICQLFKDGRLNVQGADLRKFAQYVQKCVSSE
jgi:serine/threonine protein kinase